jgi:hypothetical protein
MAAPAVYGYLCFNCLDLLEATAKDIERHWRLNSAEIGRLGLVSPPSEIGNLIISAACAEKFDDSVLALVPGFYVDFDRWRLDLDPRLRDRGIILPVCERRLIVGLRVFRHVQDQHSFVLKTRSIDRPLVEAA